MAECVLDLVGGFLCAVSVALAHGTWNGRENRATRHKKDELVSTHTALLDPLHSRTRYSMVGLLQSFLCGFDWALVTPLHCRREERRSKSCNATCPRQDRGN